MSGVDQSLCRTCTRWHEVDAGVLPTCERCGEPILTPSELNPWVGPDGRVWVGLELEGQCWRGVRVEELELEARFAVLERLSERELARVRPARLVDEMRRAA